MSIPWAYSDPIDGEGMDDEDRGMGRDYSDEDDADYLDCDEDEEWLYRCGWVRGAGCQLAGTEECDFECPFRTGNYRGLALTQARLAKRAAKKTTKVGK